MKFLLAPFQFLGKIVVNGISSVGELCCILYWTLRQVPYVFRTWGLVLKQMVSIGVSSMPLLFVTSIFTGMVATVQASFQFRGLVADKWVGTAACKMVLIELGPLLTALVLAGRVGSALAAEIASMREKEELDAHEVLGLDPYRFLAMPRFVAFFTMVPNHHIQLSGVNRRLDSRCSGSGYFILYILHGYAIPVQSDGSFRRSH